VAVVKRDSTVFLETFGKIWETVSIPQNTLQKHCWWCWCCESSLSNIICLPHTVL